MKAFKELVRTGKVAIIKEVPLVPSSAVYEKLMAVKIPASINPLQPEWAPSPLAVIDLGKGRGLAYVKDESVTVSIKRRAGWEYLKLKAKVAHAMASELGHSPPKWALDKLAIPTYSSITYGNLGEAIIFWTEKFGLPGEKLLVPHNIPKKILDRLASGNASIYMANLDERQLSASEILQYTNNPQGVELTSELFVRFSKLYDWFSHEVFKAAVLIGAKDVFVPVGSGDIFANLLYWQSEAAQKILSPALQDPRLEVDAAAVSRLNILGAKPDMAHDGNFSVLANNFEPFRFYNNDAISTARKLKLTGSNSGYLHFREGYAWEAAEILSKNGVMASKDGASGLALYLQMLDNGAIRPDAKPLIINTGGMQFCDN